MLDQHEGVLSDELSEWEIPWPFHHRDVLSDLSFNRLHLLLVDDDRAVLRVALRCLRTLPIRLTAVTSVEEAIAVDREVQPDLLLTDVELGRQSGIRLAHILWRERPTLPVIFMSGGVHVDCDGVRLSASNWCHFVPKPFSSEILRRVVIAAVEVLRDHSSDGPIPTD